MAFCDYHACDNCGERKTFYDADMSGIDWSTEQGAYLYGSNGDYEPGYRIYALCHECEKTHQIVIQPKEPTPSKEGECPAYPGHPCKVDTTMESGPNNCFHCERPM